MKTNKVIIMIPCGSSRFDMLISITNQFLERYPHFEIGVLIQHEKGHDYDINLLPINVVSIQEYNGLIGLKKARVRLIKKFVDNYDYYGVFDEDMILTEHTDYDSIIDFIKNTKDAGVVMSNWARTEGIYENKKDKMKNIFTKQVMVFTGGGEFFNNDVCKLLALEPENDSHDDFFLPIVPYINGYMNYVYRGSLTIHKTLMKSILVKHFKSVNVIYKFSEYINYIEAKNMVGYAMPNDSNLSLLAKELHKKNYKGRK